MNGMTNFTCPQLSKFPIILFELFSCGVLNGFYWDRCPFKRVFFFGSMQYNKPTTFHIQSGVTKACL